MREEDELLHRTLQRCLREVRKALDADRDVRALATCKARDEELETQGTQQLSRSRPPLLAFVCLDFATALLFGG